jgi:RNA polymerase sigma-70 factor (ECF subfamily)
VRPDERAARPAQQFTDLFEANHRQILAYALRRTETVVDAEDATAETFSVAWRRRADIPVGPDALPWLYGVARRVLANQRRGNERRWRLRTRIVEGSVGTHAGVEAPTPALDALARLRPDDRELLRLVAWEELSHAEIGRVLGITANAVAIRLHRARARFAAELGRTPERDVKGSAAARTSTSMRGRIAARLRREEP